MTTPTTFKANPSPRLLELRRHQVYRLERRRQRSVLSELSHLLRTRFHR
jgi:hypothetical protein